MFPLLASNRIEIGMHVREMVRSANTRFNIRTCIVDLGFLDLSSINPFKVLKETPTMQMTERVVTRTATCTGVRYGSSPSMSWSWPGSHGVVDPVEKLKSWSSDVAFMLQLVIGVQLEGV